MDLIEYHAERDSIVVEEDNGELVGAAFVCQIEDPFDVKFGGKVKESPSGRYLYFPLIFVREDKRGGNIIWRLIRSAFLNHIGATRMAYRRNGDRSLKIVERNHNARS